MKASFLTLVTLLMFAFAPLSWGTCPQDTIDRGLCDTMYAEPWSDDIPVQGDPPYFVRVPIYVTADVNDVWDSICGFCIPLCFTHNNATQYCSLSPYNNTTSLTILEPIRSIFRDLDGIENWMLNLYQEYEELAWDTRICNVTQGNNFWLALIPTDAPDRFFGSGSKILLATMTFKVEDAMVICIDTCFWPPRSRLAWVVVQEGGGYAFSKRPRPGTGNPNSYKVCFPLLPGSNSPPDAFSLLFPPNKAFTPRGVVPFDWETATDPNFDEVIYDLYVSTSYQFPAGSTTIESNLESSEHVKTLDYGTYYWKVKAKDDFGGERWSSQICYFMVTGVPYSDIGDFNGDDNIDIGDVVFAINYLYKSGPAPESLDVGDTNCDGTVDIGDVVHLINYLFKGGPQLGC